MYSTRDVSDYVTPRHVDVKRCSDLSFHTTRRFVMAASRDRVKRMDGVVRSALEDTVEVLGSWVMGYCSTHSS